MFAATLPQSTHDAAPRPGHASPPAHRQVDSDKLFGGALEVRIDHLGQEYRLRQTRNGKLILTK
ncbi:MAG: hemin uptake protein HemP [Proteobacteria bacterium]|uniref:hemin uptake protein HemP n=1 Tax=Rudaea sp. TaxID=2136325 RepID=UPI00321FC7D0|nr:hemin uptake protein HemP [Pseudomonadota bacterium]